MFLGFLLRASRIHFPFPRFPLLLPLFLPFPPVDVVGASVCVPPGEEKDRDDLPRPVPFKPSKDRQGAGLEIPLFPPSCFLFLVLVNVDRASSLFLFSLSFDHSLFSSIDLVRRNRGSFYIFFFCS
jgi:hypothetical protein